MVQQFHSWVYIQRKKKTLIQKYICTSVFIAVLFTIAKIWRQTQCPTTNGWIKKLGDKYIYIYIYI